MDFVSKRKYFLGFSFIISILSIFMLISNGLNLGIDFTSGSTASLEFKEGDPGAAAILSELEGMGYSESVVQNIGESQYFIRTRDLGVNGLTDIKDALNELEESPVIILDNTTVGASIAEDTVKNAVIAVLVASALKEKTLERIDIVSHNILGKLSGSALNEIEADHPFLDRKSLFISGTHVTDEMGTGLVHTAPAHGIDDYHACLGKDLDFRSPVDEKGEFIKSQIFEEISKCKL